MSRDGTFTDKKARTGLEYAPLISREEGLNALSNNSTYIKYKLTQIKTENKSPSIKRDLKKIVR